MLRKRDKKDGEIDWTKPAASIYNLVRALTRPYVGAHCRYMGAEPRVWAAALEPSPGATARPGEVLNVKDTAITVQCGDGALTLLDHEITNLPATGDTL